jgi:hypothetical protein
MPLPPELIDEPAETTVVGHVDALIAYVESGQALLDWNERINMRLKELDEVFGNPAIAA